MLHALLRGKRPGGAVPDPRDREDAGPLDVDLLARREDPLTASVFERLAYLPGGLSAAIVLAASKPLGEDPAVEPALPAGRPTWTFWPSLRPGEGAHHRQRVEPDLVVAWDAAVWVFEVKHRGVQRTGQWVEQIRAVHSDRRWKGRGVTFFAVGGLRPEDDSSRSSGVRAAFGAQAPALRRLSWAALHSEVDRQLSSLEGHEGIAAVLRDVGAALDLWDHRLPLGLGSLREEAGRFRRRRADAARVLEDWGKR